MELNATQGKFLPSRGLKQVKVDNWGTFFLQRLLQLYFNEELLDLNIKFHTSDHILKVHRLVITTCTDFFAQLEREQNMDQLSNNVTMPSDMPYECVKSIISFMYTGQLEYWTSEQEALYRTAQKMKMSILTKLLDAQFNTNISQDSSLQKLPDKTSISSLKESISNKKSLSTKSLTVKELPVWKKKLDNHSNGVFAKHTMETCYSGPNYLLENTGGPSRFDLPEIEELTLGVFSSFDDITYNTKPIVRAPDKFTNDTKSERKLSNAIMPDIFLSYGNDENLIKKRNQNDSSDDDWAGGESFLNFEDDQMSSMNKRIRYDHDEKENFSTSQVNNLLGSDNTSATSLNNHAKIIREVLKKYPHLVKNNKNIRLKIMHKESKNMEFSTAGKTKVSYIVLKSDSLMTDSVDKMGLSNTNSDIRLETSEMGPWQCSKCNLEEHYIDYYMYRRHMQDVHEERFDPRICEHCGYKATKRNILMYHMYTKHSVLPPKNMSFPKCQACSYIALSESLLLRHQINHKHQLPTLAFQHFSCRSFQCNESEKVFNDASTFTCKIKDKDVLSTDINDLNIKETSCYCLHCGKYFMNMKKMNDNKNSHTEISKLLEQSTIKSTVSEQTSNIENFRSLSSSSLNLTSSFRTGDILKPMTANEQKFTKLKASNNTCSNPQLQHQQVVMLINDDNYSVGASKDECSIDAINNEIVIQNSDGNMIIYVQDVNNIINSHDFRTNPADENYINSSSTDEILEEVVEELETIENDNEEKRLDCEKRKMTEILNHDANDTQIKNIFHSKKIADISSNAEKVIQYVEEETEILEYETCSNA